MKNSIALIGFMGVGKTSVAKALAAKLGKEFIEMDAIIEQKAGKSIAEMFQQDGEIAFRELEIAVAKEVSQKQNAVIACGGGVVLNRINIDRLKQECIIVYLAAAPAVILQRTSEGDRPLLRTPDRAFAIRKLLEFRQPFYERAADIEIDTSGMDADSVAEQIMSRIKVYEGYDS
ncbi:MAG: shikimate kinase [Chloroflexota bacterium]